MNNRQLIFLCLFFYASASFASVSMTRVDPKLYVNGAKTDFKEISNMDPKKKKELVKALFDERLLEHEHTLSFETNATFEKYYAKQKNNFLLIDINQDGSNEIIFQGYVIDFSEKEYTEIYGLIDGAYKRIYQQIGHLLAYTPAALQ